MADDDIGSRKNKDNKEKYECELCLDVFNLYDRKPVCLVPCGHSLCMKCFDSLRKNVCPFCRVPYENKIINWEISKRLPKPTIPILYYQTQIKLGNLKDLLSEFTKINHEANLNIKNNIQLIKESEDLKSKSVSETNNNGIIDKIKDFEKTLSESHQENLESESSLKKMVDTFKTQIELDENKYSEENLKKIRTESENVFAYFKDKLSMIKNEDEKIKEILSRSIDNISIDENVIKKLQMEIDERKKRVTLSRQLAVLFSNANTSIRPATNASSEANLNENTNEIIESTSFSPSQKKYIIIVISVVSIICMIYPITMICLGAINRDQCSINSLIPVWLLVGGSCACSITLLTGTFLIYTVLRFFVRKTFKERLVVILFVLLPLTFLIVFNLAWFFAGNAWIYSVYKTVQFEDKTASSYCNQQVYLFAFWTLNASYIFIGAIIFAINLICCCFCCLKKEN